MSLFHRHVWVTTSETFSPPTRQVERVSNVRTAADRDYALSILYGLTTIRQECSACGEVALRTVPGDATHAGAEATP